MASRISAESPDGTEGRRQDSGGRGMANPQRGGRREAEAGEEPRHLVGVRGRNDAAVPGNGAAQALVHPTEGRESACRCLEQVNHAGVREGAAAPDFDTAKAVAFELKLPVVIVPTIASTDAPCSALSVIYTDEGAFERYLVLPRNPDVVIVDTALVAKAPVRFLVAGMGDALATWFEADSCRIRRAANMTGRPGTMTAYALARLCYDTLLEYGPLAMSAVETQSVTPALDHVVEANTLLSGLGFESGGLAACHAIHNGLTSLRDTHAFWHGEKVAIGVLAALFLTDKRKDMIDEVYGFCESVGLPTTLDDIGLANASDADLELVARTACAPGETIHNEPADVKPETVLWALKTADREGRRRAQRLAT